MGRPLNKRMFTGLVAGATAGKNEIKVDFHNGTAVVEGTIIKQKGSKKFVVAETGAADVKVVCTLKTGILPANLTAGQMAISVQGDDAETYGVSKITGRKVTLAQPSASGSNALDGKSLKWDFAAAAAGKVQLEEAGDNDIDDSDDDNFAEDV